MEKRQSQPEKNILKKTNFRSDETTFKICVYYSHRNTGIPYNIAEIELKENRKYHNSIDFIPGKDRYNTRHDIALNKLINHIQKNRSSIIQALVYCNDIKNKKQYLIGKYGKNSEFDRFIQPKYVSYNQGKDVFINGFIAEPLDEFDIINFTLNKKQPIKQQ